MPGIIDNIPEKLYTIEPGITFAWLNRTAAMRINVRIKPRSSKNRVEKTDAGYTVSVTAPPVDNKANIALIEALSGHFDIPKSRIKIVFGLKSKNKIVEIA